MNWSTWINNKVNLSIKSVLSLWPVRRCEICLEPCHGHIVLCHACYDSLPDTFTCCTRCSVPLPENRLCNECIRTPPVYGRSHCSYLYIHPVSIWVKRLKQRRRTEWARYLAELMLLNPPDVIKSADAIICVPSDRRALLMRGFNPAEQIASCISRKTGLPVLHGIITRRTGKPQKLLTARERATNVHKSYSVQPRRLNGQHILLVDDVMTTGNTVNTVSKLLLDTGASAVTVWCTARTPKR